MGLHNELILVDVYEVFFGGEVGDREEQGSEGNVS